MVHVPYISSRLPPYPGSYPVGAFDLEVPFDGPDAGHRLSSFTWKPHPDIQPLRLETLLFTLYYPAEDDGQKRKRVGWFPRPFVSTAKGYARFAGAASLPSVWLTSPPCKISKAFANFLIRWTTVSFAHAIARSTKMPAHVNAPLAKLPDGQEFPLIIFSHGLAGQRRMYSHLCGALASHGYIVAAVEHRDGSAPTSFIYPPPSVDGETPKPEKVVWTDWKQLAYNDPSKEESHVPLRDEQLRFRVREIEELRKVLVRIMSGEGKHVEAMNRRKGVKCAAKDIDWDRWTGTFDVDKDVTLMGHSFGAATTLRAARELPNFARCVTLDPWSWWCTFPPGAHFVPFTAPRGDINVPILTVNSEFFALWDDNWRAIQGLHMNQKARDKEAWLLTICGTLHTTFSDLDILTPRLAKQRGLTVSPLHTLNTIVDLSLDFIQGRAGQGRWQSFSRNERDETLAKRNETLAKRDESDRKGDRIKLGQPGEIVLHVRTKESAHS